MKRWRLSWTLACFGALGCTSTTSTTPTLTAAATFIGLDQDVTGLTAIAPNMNADGHYRLTLAVTGTVQLTSIHIETHLPVRTIAQGVWDTASTASAVIAVRNAGVPVNTGYTSTLQTLTGGATLDLFTDNNLSIRNGNTVDITVVTRELGSQTVTLTLGGVPSGSSSAGSSSRANSSSRAVSSSSTGLSSTSNPPASSTSLASSFRMSSSGPASGSTSGGTSVGTSQFMGSTSSGGTSTVSGTSDMGSSTQSGGNSSRTPDSSSLGGGSTSSGGATSFVESGFSSSSGGSSQASSLLGSSSASMDVSSSSMAGSSSSSGGADLSTGLLAVWNLDEPLPGTGPGATDVVDASGNNHHGLVTGAVGFGITGNLGTAVTMDGATGRIQVPDAPTLQPQHISISVWFRLSAPLTAAATLVCKPVGDAPWTFPFASWLIRLNSATVIEGAVSTSPSSYSGTSATVPALQPDTWYHYVLTFNGSVVVAYLNGVLVAENNFSSALYYAPQPVIFGADHGAAPAGDHFAGAMDQVAIWDHALTAQDVTALYNAGAGVALP